MSATQTGSELRSRRYVTQGYRNVFHRAFLYGMGLSEQDMRQPFAGLAVAHSEAAPGQGQVRALANLAKRVLPSVGFTEREFVVPESLESPESALVTRELVADSAELVVRGHWYDALVGVAGSPSAAFGLAQTLVRLRVPGIVLVPAERVALDAHLQGAAAALESLGLAAVVSVEDRGTLAEVLAGVTEQVRGSAAALEVADRLHTMAPVPAAHLVHLCALAHEAGVTSLEGVAGLVPVTVGGPGGVVGLGVPGTTSYAVVPADVRAPAVPPGPDLPLVLATHAEVSGELTASDWAPETGVALLSGCDHPGPVDSALNYDRL